MLISVSTPVLVLTMVTPPSPFSSSFPWSPSWSPYLSSPPTQIPYSCPLSRPVISLTLVLLSTWIIITKILFIKIPFEVSIGNNIKNNIRTRRLNQTLLHMASCYEFSSIITLEDQYVSMKSHGKQGDKWNWTFDQWSRIYFYSSSGMSMRSIWQPNNACNQIMHEMYNNQISYGRPGRRKACYWASTCLLCGLICFM